MDMKFAGKVWTGSAMLDVCNPKPSQVIAKDIAQGLSRASRFSGHTRPDLPPYSVAFHSLFCEAIADQMGLPVWVRLQALLHDAPEYVLGDMIKPVKVLVSGYAPLEVNVWTAVSQRFQIPGAFHTAIKDIDGIAFEVERFHLIAPGAWEPAPVIPDEWAALADRWMDFTLRNEKAHGPSFSAALFLSRLNALLDARTQDAGA